MALYEITEIAGQDGADDVYDIDDSIRWKEDIAMHSLASSQHTLKEFTTHWMRIEETRHALTMSSTGRTTRFAECIRAREG